MQFKKITLEDKEVIDSVFRKEDYRGCEMTFACAWLWKDHYALDYALVDGMIVLRSTLNGTSFSLPIGIGDKKAVVEKLRKYCKEEQIPFHLHGVSREGEEFLNREYPDEFMIEFNRDDADYVYLAEKLSTLSGKKYHGKRNHINKFKGNHEWNYEPITDKNREECLAMLAEWKNQNCAEEDLEKHSEICVSENSLIHMEKLGLTGGAIRAEGVIIAFAIGEQLTKDTFVVHVEKAFGHIQGAYPLINQQFVIHEAGDSVYINREEDCGEEGLRKAKLSYRPVMMIEKANAWLISEQ